MPEITYTRPLPTYPVAYNGTMPAGSVWAAGNEVIIPRMHKRPGDDEDNLVVEYIITFDIPAGPFGLNQAVYIYDNDSNKGIVVCSQNCDLPYRLQMDNDLRMACIGASPTTYCVMAFYAKPTNR